MTIRINDERVVVAKVMEKEEAARAFAVAKAEGRAAYMLTVGGVAALAAAASVATPAVCMPTAP